MKKISIIMQSKDVEASLLRLQNLGLLHLEHCENTPHERMEPLAHEINALEQAIDILKSVCICSVCGSKKCRCKKKVKLSAQTPNTSNWKRVTEEVLALHDQMLILKDESAHLEKKHSDLAPWGDFDPAFIIIFRMKKIYCRFYNLPTSKLDDIPDDLYVHIIQKDKNNTKALFVSRGSNFTLPYDEFIAPKEGLLQMESHMNRNHEKVIEMEKEIAAHLKNLSLLELTLNNLYSEKNFLEALCGAGRKGKLIYVKGFAPEECTEKIQKCAKEENWGTLVEEPSSDDKIPTLIKNPRWIRIINPVFDFIKTLPGYSEFDISHWFLLFFSVFFGMLIGDAGYGAIFLFANFYAHMKMRFKVKDKAFFVLMYLLSISTIIWGSLTGTFFGQIWVKPFIEPLLPALTTERTMQIVCFLIGAIHLSIAHGWRFISKFPHPKAFSDLGWLLVIWCAYFLSRFLILDDPLPFFINWLFIAGTSLIVFFTNPSRRIFRTIGSGFGDLLMNVINSFTDIVSYIRLFAVGLATVSIADATNTMALQSGFGDVASGFIAAVVLLIGHGLNIVLAAMGVLVHGIRLNVLEFSSHLGMEWGGTAYKPFQTKPQNFD